MTDLKIQSLFMKLVYMPSLLTGSEERGKKEKKHRSDRYVKRLEKFGRDRDDCVVVMAGLAKLGLFVSAMTTALSNHLCTKA